MWWPTSGMPDGDTDNRGPPPDRAADLSISIISPAPRLDDAEFESRGANVSGLKAGSRQQFSVFLVRTFATAQADEHVEVGPGQRDVALVGA